MNGSVLLRDLVLTISGIAVGGAGYLCLLHLVDLRHGMRRALAYLLARAGFATIVALVARVIARLPGLELRWDVAVYALGLTAAGAGYTVIAYDSWQLTRPLRELRRATRKERLVKVRRKIASETTATAFSLPAAFWAAFEQHDYVLAALALAGAILPHVVTWWKRQHSPDRG